MPSTRFATVTIALAVSLAATTDAGAVRVGDSGWFWGNPRPQGNSLKDLELVGPRGYAVGEAGTLLRTDDGGETWSGLPSGGTSLRGGSLFEVDAVNAGTVVVPTADACTLRRSDDGGRSFRRLRLVPRGTRCPGAILSFSFPSPAVAYAAVESGVVFRTADGGATWSRRAPIPNTPVSGGGEASALDLRFVSASTGIAISDAPSAGRIHRTIDGGATWRQVHFAPAGLKATDFADALTGWVVGAGGTLLKTINGGETWSRPPLVGAGGADDVYTEVSCADSQTCLFGRASASPLRTANGGATVTAVPSLSASDVMDFASPSRAVGLGDAGFTAISNDGGRSFARLDRRLPGELSRLRATSPQLAVAFGGARQLALTQDGGRSWRFVGAPTTDAPRDASFVTPTLGYVLEGNGSIVRTRNGGDDWQDAATVPASGLLARSPSLVLAAGRAGVRRSTDGAASFRRVGRRALRGRRLNELDPAGGAVFAFGGRALARSANEGRSWRRIRRPTRREIVDVDFVNARVGYAVAQAGGAGQRLYRTANAGRSWRWLRGLGTPELYSVSFATGRSGFVDVDDDTGRTLRTTDGGRTWRPQLISASTLTVGGLVATGPGSGLALDADGRIFATTTGGDALGPSSLSLRASSRRLRRSRRITLSGRLTPRLADEQIVIASLIRGRWGRRTVETAPDGSFRLRVRVRRTTRFVAQWEGDGASRGAGTVPVRVLLRR